jgi:hypothetical protein
MSLASVAIVRRMTWNVSFGNPSSIASLCSTRLRKLLESMNPPLRPGKMNASDESAVDPCHFFLCSDVTRS